MWIQVLKIIMSVGLSFHAFGFSSPIHALRSQSGFGKTAFIRQNFHSHAKTFLEHGQDVSFPGMAPKPTKCEVNFKIKNLDQKCSKEKEPI